MKSDYLKELLDIKHAVADYGEYIGIGSWYVHDLIRIDKKTFEVSKSSIVSDGELLRIFDELKNINKTKMRDIVMGNNGEEYNKEVYYCESGKIRKTYCKEYGYPNTTIDGVLMYDNTHYKNPLDAVVREIEGLKIGIKYTQNNIIDLDDNLRKQKEKLNEYMKEMEELKRVSENLSKNNMDDISIDK